MKRVPVYLSVHAMESIVSALEFVQETGEELDKEELRTLEVLKEEIERNKEPSTQAATQAATQEDHE